MLVCCCIRGSCALAAWPASMCASRRSASLTLRGLVLARVLSLVLSFPLSRRPKCVLSLSMPCERLLSIHVHVLQPPPLVVAARRSGGSAWGCAGEDGGNQGDHMLTVQALKDMRRVLQGMRTVPLVAAGHVLGPRCVVVLPLLFLALQKGSSLVGSTDPCCVSDCPLQARASCKSSLTHWHWRAWWLKIYVELLPGRLLMMTVRRSRGLNGYLSVWFREHHGTRPRGGAWSEVGGRLGRGW